MNGANGPFPGGFRVFTVGRDAAQRFRVRAPWRVRANAGPFERALVGALTFLLALPVAALLLALGLVLLAVFLGCAAIFIAFALAAWLVRRVFGVGAAPHARRERPAADDGRENVRVLPRQDPFE
jgi:small-conductance mechanosensitive channel